MNQEKQEEFAPEGLYLVTGVVAIALLIGGPVVAWTCIAALWAKILASIAWVILWMSTSDRYVPRVVNPIIEWIYWKIRRRPWGSPPA